MTMRKLKKKVYLIGGRPELVIYGDIEPVFASTELRPADSSIIESEHDAIRIYFLGGALAREIPVEIPEALRTIINGSEVCITTDGITEFGEWYGRAGSVVDTTRKLAVIVFPGLRNFNRDFVSRFIFRPILDELLCLSGYIPLHAAGVACHGAGCIITGYAGSGKTSLIDGLMDMGFDFLADDRVVVKRGDRNSVCMYAMPEYIRRAVTARGPKHKISPPAVSSEKVPVKYILFLGKKKRGKTFLKALSGTEAAARLMQAVSANPEPRMRQQMFELITDMCQKAVSYDLSGHGSIRKWVRSAFDLFNK